MKSKIYLIISILFLVSSISSCKKYLDQKPLQSQIVPSTLSDLQALLDNNNFINNQSTPNLPELSSDNFYVNTTDYQFYNTFVSEECLDYVWDKNAGYTTAFGGWQEPYKNAIYYSNIVLDILPTIPLTTTNKDLWNSIKGSALFYRALAFEGLAQVYCKPYSSTANTDAGIVLKLTSNINEKIVRSTVQQTYDKIISDLKQAADLLSANVLFPTRPNQSAAYGALARTYLSMSDYINAGNYSNLCLQQNSTLLDYNTLIPVGNPPIPKFNLNPETLFYGTLSNASLTGIAVAKIDSGLYQSYNINDLRKIIFFKPNTGANAGTYQFQGSYSITKSQVFTGIATDEMFLTRAECYARAGNTSAAITDLNALLVKRWKTGTFTPLTATDALDAKNKVLTERRKELIFRGLRWSDLRRLNLEGANITLTRIINGITYTLPPNDLRWVLLIPQEVINLSGVQQNPR